MGVPTQLNCRQLNRAVLARQHLLARTERSAATVVEDVQGLNAQNANDPYIALWARLAEFSLVDLTAAISDRRLVRGVAMRGTQHLLTGADFSRLRPALAPLLRRQQRNVFGRKTPGVDPSELAVQARTLLGEEHLTRPELGRRLAEMWPDAEAAALGWSVQLLEPLVHPPPVGGWNYRGPMHVELADEWIGDPGVRRGAGDKQLDDLVLGYLRAFGPASPSDARAWSGVSGLRDVFDRLRPGLRTYRGPRGRELFDLPEAARPGADVDAPMRFLPEFDASLLAYHDRTRLMRDDVRRRVCVGDAVAATVLIDGFVEAVWSVEREGSERTTLTVSPFRRLSADERSAVESQGVRLLDFTDAGVPVRDVRVVREET